MQVERTPDRPGSSAWLVSPLVSAELAGHSLLRAPLLLVWNEQAGQYVAAPDNACTARWASAAAGLGGLCAGTGEFRAGDSWLCAHHYRRAQQWVHQTAAAERQQREQAALQEATRRERSARAAAARRNTIYYVQRESDSLIKIGTTANFDDRLLTLKREHGTLTVLLTHRGSYTRERRLHARFRSLLAEKREWFHPGPELLEWIADPEVRRAGGVRR